MTSCRRSANPSDAQRVCFTTVLLEKQPSTAFDWQSGDELSQLFTGEANLLENCGVARDEPDHVRTRVAVGFIAMGRRWVCLYCIGITHS